MGLMFFLGMPLLPPRAKIKAWGFGGDEKQLSMKDIFVSGSAGALLAALGCGAFWTVCGAALACGLQPLLVRAP